MREGGAQCSVWWAWTSARPLATRGGCHSACAVSLPLCKPPTSAVARSPLHSCWGVALHRECARPAARTWAPASAVRPRNSLESMWRSPASLRASLCCAVGRHSLLCACGPVWFELPNGGVAPSAVSVAAVSGAAFRPQKESGCRAMIAVALSVLACVTLPARSAAALPSIGAATRRLTHRRHNGGSRA